MRAVNYTGRVFGTWEALEPLPERKSGTAIKWLFRCTQCQRTKKRPGTQMAHDHKTGSLQQCACRRALRQKQRQERMLATYYATGSMAETALRFGVTRQYVKVFLKGRIDFAKISEIVRCAPRELLAEAVLKGAGMPSLIRIVGRLTRTRS